MARDRGASKVYLTDVSSERLEVALDAIGQAVDDAWVSGDDNGVQDVLSRTDGVGVDPTASAVGSAGKQPRSRPPCRWHRSAPSSCTSRAYPSAIR